MTYYYSMCYQHTIVLQQILTNHCKAIMQDKATKDNQIDAKWNHIAHLVIVIFGDYKRQPILTIILIMASFEFNLKDKSLDQISFPTSTSTTKRQMMKILRLSMSMIALITSCSTWMLKVNNYSHVSKLEDNLEMLSFNRTINDKDQHSDIYTSNCLYFIILLSLFKEVQDAHFIKFSLLWPCMR